MEYKEGKILFYKAKDGNFNLGVLCSDETVWITQVQMVELYQRDKSVTLKHIKNIFIRMGIRFFCNCCKICNSSK